MLVWLNDTHRLLYSTVLCVLSTGACSLDSCVTPGLTLPLTVALSFPTRTLHSEACYDRSTEASTCFLSDSVFCSRY